MRKQFISAVVTLVFGSAGAALAAPSVYSRASALDLGSIHSFGPDSAITVTVALKLNHADELDALIQSTYDSASPNYRHFLTPQQFAQRFGPTTAAIERVTRHLQSAGFTVEAKSFSHLRVTGKLSGFEREFGVRLHTFEIPATPNAAAFRFREPDAAPQLSSAIADDVEAVVGLDNRPRLRPMNHRLPSLSSLHAVRPAATAPDTPDAPGLWTVQDLAKYYNVLPLYNKGISGHKRTIGIVTLASFTPSDAFAYWASLGLKVNSKRITVVNIDGGPGTPSDASGSDETTLDVEQSGGLAPDARIIVYQAPNTDQAFVDAFEAAVSSNEADAVSCSWGEWEEFLVQGTRISDPDSAGDMRAMHNLFIQAALQGQSLSAASGDAGSFDNAGPFFNDVLSVDHPAADPFMLAAGGTTLPGDQDFTLNDGSPFTVSIPKERAWSWDYLNGFCAKLGVDPVMCGIFPVGSGGGVSLVWRIPLYQRFVPGMRTSEPGQVLSDVTKKPPAELLKLPAHFPGRNLPDISLNADPDTGYTVFYTSSQNGFEILSFFGGTSFVAPQLAGITALLDQNAGQRLGLLSFPLYELALTRRAYSGKHPPLRDINKGNNEFYQAVPGYDQATGLGVLDVANLAALLK
ncbi:MAG: S8/S53 family peptidase [Proteobacteria bacterium]|nr:S8/S53 family peptidase [Pseudomonadota bacterium]